MTIKEIDERFKALEDSAHLTFLEQVKQNLNLFPWFQNEDMLSRIEDNFLLFFDSKECFIPVEESSFMSDLLKIRYTIFNLFFTNQYKYQHLYDTLSLEYNPIENYNGREEETIGDTKSETETRDLQTKKSGSVMDDGHTAIGDISVTDSTTEKISPFDDNDFKNKSNSVNTVSDKGRMDTASNTQTTDLLDKNTGTVQNTGTSQTTRTLEKSGNIGVTTSQEMIMQERRVAEYLFYNIICDDINNCICVGVW